MQDVSVLAFDHDAIHAGNKGLAIDDDAVSAAVEDLLARMTLEQKLNEIHGLQMAPIDGLYHAGGDESLGIPAYRMVDGPRGARSGTATAFPVAMGRGATFDVALERRVGLAVGAEVAAKGGNVVLAPTINLLRHPGWGRAQETYSEDPYHLGAMGVAFISGVQNYVLASPKHFAANNVEMTRFEMTANLSPRVLHEVYLPHFKRAIVEGGASSIMSAYNKLNEVYCGENPVLLTDILRRDWGFKGFVESDWFLGTRSTAPAILAGLDIEMPAAYRFSTENVEAALRDGDLSEDTITDAARHALYMKVAWDLANPPDVDPTVVECDEHRALAREVAAKSVVLLKNEGGVLPLGRRQRIAVVGDLAGEANLGDRGSSMVTSSTVVTPLEGLGRLGSAVQAATDFADLAELDVTVVVAGLTYREEGEYIPTQQQNAEGDQLARGGDRVELTLPDAQVELIRAAAAASNKTVVVLEGGSAIQVESWVDDVDGLLMVWYPGCEGGNGIADVVFGETNPSGKLPVTIPKSSDQLVPWDRNALVVEHELLPGYRYVDQGRFEPRFPFGFGLSYTTFAIDNLFVERMEGGFSIDVDVTNTGARSGATVVQLYVSYRRSSVDRPVVELKGFGRLEVEPGASATLVIEVFDEDLRYYDERASEWVLERCEYVFHAGFSSRDLPLEQEWRLGVEGFEPI